MLPEGVFGVIDDLTPAFPLDKLHETPWERERREAKEREPEPFKITRIPKKKRAKRPNLPDRLVPGLEVNKDHYADTIPNVEYDNTVEVPEDLLNQMRKKTGVRTKDLSHLLMSRILPTFLGLDAAESYTVAAMRDALGVEIDIDNSVSEAAKQLANLDLVYYFVRRSTMPKKFKQQYLMTLVEESAKATVASMNSQNNSKSKSLEKELANYQAIVRAAATMRTQSEDRNRKATKKTNPSHRREKEQEVPFAESLLGVEGRVPAPAKEQKIGVRRSRGPM